MPSIQETATYITNTVDPYVPQVAKNAASYAVEKASSAVDYAQKTVTSSVDYAKATVNTSVDYAQKTVNGTVDYAKNKVQDGATFVHESVSYAKQSVSDKANQASAYASTKAQSALEFGKVVVNGATTTVTTYTPGPVLKLVTSSIEGAKSISKDPVGTVKPYVPSFVIHAGEKTYEIVSDISAGTAQQVQATTGFIVTKVNNTVQSITQVPAIHNLIEQLNKLTAPVLAKLGVSKTSSVEDKADGPAVEPVEDDSIEAKEQ